MLDKSLLDHKFDFAIADNLHSEVRYKNKQASYPLSVQLAEQIFGPADAHIVCGSKTLLAYQQAIEITTPKF